MKYILFFSILLTNISVYSQGLDFDDADLNDIDESELLNHIEETKAPDSAFTDLTTLLTYISQDSLFRTLQSNIYNHTNPAHDRSLLDLPSLYYYEISHVKNNCYNLSLGVTPFYNQTSRMHLTCTSKMSDYIDLTKVDLSDEIIQLISFAAPELNDVNQILPIFANIQLQQRRIGGFFRIGLDIPRWAFQWEIPLYYLERNFFLTQCEIDSIRSTDLIRNRSSNSTQQETQELFIQHLLTDKFGFGDSRISAFYTAFQNDCHCFYIGGQITIPTAHAFKKGLMGGHLCINDKKIASPNTENLVTLFNIFLDPLSVDPSTKLAAFKQAYAFLFGVLDRLTAIICDTSLGNNKHVVLAPLFEWRTQPLDWLGFITRGTIQFFTPAKERRFFLRNIDLSPFITNFTDDDEAAFNFKVIDQALINGLIPEIFHVRVQPGPLIELTEQVTFTHHWFQTALGYDFWWQGQEHIRAPQGRLDTNQFSKGITPAAYQQKLFGYFGVKLDYPDYRFDIALHWDATFASKGIGKDFTLGLAFRWLF